MSMKNSEISALNIPITFYKKVRIRQPDNSFRTEMKASGDVWASIRFKTGRELIKNAILAENSVIVRVYNDEIARDIDADDLIKFFYFGEEVLLGIVAKNYEMASGNFVDFICTKGIASLNNGNS